MNTKQNEIARHKTAIRRPTFSRPIKCLLRDGLIGPSTTVFDYGCGHGIELLRGIHIPCDGWDPVHRPHGQPQPADVVNLGCVINVIEKPLERAEALRQAWNLCRRFLVVAAQTDLAAPDKAHDEFGDGVLTSRNTFQKYYNQHELRAYLERELRTDAIPAAPGIFYVFRDETVKQQFLATRYQRHSVVPRKQASEIVFEQNQDVLEPFMAILATLGRLPGPEEFPLTNAVTDRFGSLKRAFALVRRVTEEEPWEAIAQRRTEDLLVYLALSRFEKRPSLSQLPPSIQLDIKSFLGSYREACQRADVLLFRAGDSQAIDVACQRATVGQLVDNALVVHRCALDTLEPLLRIYEGCGRALVGDIEDANLIKLHRFSGKLSYLSYPEFDTDPHPAMRVRVKVSLRTLSIDYFDYTEWPDPPILHRKEAFLPAEHPLAEKFARLTKQEEELGLLGQVDGNDTRRKFERRLHEAGFVLRGHRLSRDRSPPGGPPQ